jgi:ABC-type multidrug transport system fused ATPase/permease subunit
MLENIQSQGYDVAPVGHHDSQNNDIQWRISFPGELNLFLDLTDVQTLCYALIKIILRENLNTSQREVVSSFHIKHVLFWCVERCSCQWVDSNYINCLNICLTKLIEMIKARHISHYIIESRNLFNSKMTEKMSKEIIDVLGNYDTTHVFTLDAFDRICNLTHYNNALLKREALRSTIMACFIAYFANFSSYVCCPSSFWGLFIPHNVTNSLLKYKNILQNLKKVKGVCIQFSTYFVMSMVGFLYYAKYKESNKTNLYLHQSD